MPGSVKEQARKLIERLPDQATWDDVEYEIYVRRAVEAGLADSDAGRVEPVDLVRKGFGLSDD
jgi:predicted transcriptional regulator